MYKRIASWGVVMGSVSAFQPVSICAQVRDSVKVDSTVIQLDSLLVQPLRAAATAGGTSAIDVAVSALNLSPSATVEQMLRVLPMIHVRTNSRGEAEVLARNSESRQVAVLVDGIPLTLTWDGRADVSVLPATAPQEVRFVRGLSTMLHGPNVLAGGVEMTITGERAMPPRSLSVSTGVDTEGGGAISTAGTLPWETDRGQWLVRAGGGLRASPGVPLARGVREPMLVRHNRRLNTDVNNIDGFFATRFRSRRGPWISGSAFGFRSERGVAAEIDMPAPRFWRYPLTRRAVGVLSAGTGFHRTPIGGTGDLEMSVGYNIGRTEIDAYSDRSYSARTSYENGTDRTVTLRLLGDHTLGHRGDLRGSYTLADIAHREELPGAVARYRQRLSSLAAESEWRLADRLGPILAPSLSIGAAWDHGATLQAGDKPSSPEISDWGGRIGLTTLLARGNSQLHGSVSRRGRFPALREAFSGSLERFVPNPQLSPEHLVAIEAGVTTHFRSGQIQVVGFHHRLDDAIVRISLPDGKFKRVNENQLRTMGLELLASYASNAVELGGDLTLTEAELVTPIARQGHVENQPELFGSVRAGAPLLFGMRTTGELRYTGKQYCLAANGEDVRLAAGTRFNGDLSREWRLRTADGGMLSRGELRLSVDNIMNNAIYDQCGLPQPGRLIRFTIRVL